jgi:hypothetical protein
VTEAIERLGLDLEQSDLNEFLEDENSNSENKKMIDLTPSWTAFMPGLCAVLEYGDAEGKRMAREELMSLARAVDTMNSRAKEAASHESTSQDQA